MDIVTHTLAGAVVASPLRRHASTLCPEGTGSLIPSALLPWRFFGYARRDGLGRLFQLDALSGRIERESVHEILDSRVARHLEGCVEFQLMRELSPAYHVTHVSEEDGQLRIRCQDLRTRNFGGTFGSLELTFRSTGALESKVFHA